MGSVLKKIFRSDRSRYLETAPANDDDISPVRSSDQFSIPVDYAESASIGLDNNKKTVSKCCCGDHAAAWTRRPPPPFKFNCLNIFRDFSENSSVHGMKYVGGRNRSLVERVCFIFAIITMIVCCSISISNLWHIWQKNPLIITLAERPTRVWEIPFPAVTLCPETKADADIFNLTQVVRKMTLGEGPELSERELQHLDALRHICDGINWNTTAITEIVRGEDIADTLRSIQGNYSAGNILHCCHFSGEDRDCDLMFKPVLTDEGLCFTFNIFGRDSLFHDTPLKEFYPGGHSDGSKFWNMETGYTKLTVDTYPHHVMTGGERGGLSMFMFTDPEDLEYICRGPIQGFKVHLHMPGEIPQIGKQFFRVPLSQEVMVAVKPMIIQTSPEVRNYDLLKRQCYFSGERSLTFFKEYTQQNCEVECLSNYTLRKCGCVKFSAPRSHNTPICNSPKIECYENAEKMYVYPTQVEIHDQLIALPGCNCLPSCTIITYNVEATQAKINMYPYLKQLNASQEDMGFYQHMSRLNLHFKESQFIACKRSELNGVYNFLAGCGGLMGLFMGFSLVSFVEIFYYLTIRVFWSLQKARE